MDNEYAASAASMLRHLAEEFETGKHQNTSSVIVSFYDNGLMLASHGRHKAKRNVENANG